MEKLVTAVHQITAFFYGEQGRHVLPLQQQLLLRDPLHQPLIINLRLFLGISDHLLIKLGLFPIGDLHVAGYVLQNVGIGRV
jgi:hypothetical protein